MSAPRSLSFALALSALCGLGSIGCEDQKPAPKLPPQPSGANPIPGQPQIGISDVSSVRSADGLPANRPGMSGSASGSYQQAMQAFANGDLPTAKRLFEQATQSDPHSHQAFYSLGVVQDRLKDGGAAASYRQAFTLVPDYEPAIIAYAMMLAKKGQLGEADRFLAEKRGQMPKSAAVAATLAEVKSLQKDTGSAQRLAQEALKLNPDYRPAMVIIARDHFRNRRLDLALYALQAILDGFEPVADNPPRDKDNGEALLLRGLIYKEQNNRFGAMDQFRKAVAHRPDLVEARVQLGAALLSSGGAEEALPILEGAVRYDADNVAGHLNLGDAYRLVQKYDDSKREFEWVLGRDAALPAVHYDLGLLYLYAPNIPGDDGEAADRRGHQGAHEVPGGPRPRREGRLGGAPQHREGERGRGRRRERAGSAASTAVRGARSSAGSSGTCGIWRRDPAASCSRAARRSWGSRSWGTRRSCSRRARIRWRSRRAWSFCRSRSSRNTWRASRCGPWRTPEEVSWSDRRRLPGHEAKHRAHRGGVRRARRIQRIERVGAGQGQGVEAARRHHARRRHDHRPHPEADRVGRREPHRAQADARGAAPAVPRSNRTGDLPGSVLTFGSGNVLSVVAALVGAGSAALAWAQARRAAKPPASDRVKLANRIKALPREQRLQALAAESAPGTWEHELAREVLAAPGPRQPAAVNLALSEIDHVLTEGDGWPGAGVRIALLSGALLGFVAYLAGAPVGSAVGDLAIGGVSALLCFEAGRTAKRSVQGQRAAVDRLVNAVFGDLPASAAREARGSSERARPARRRRA